MFPKCPDSPLPRAKRWGLKESLATLPRGAGPGPSGSPTLGLPGQRIRTEPSGFWRERRSRVSHHDAGHPAARGHGSGASSALRHEGQAASISRQTFRENRAGGGPLGVGGFAPFSGTLLLNQCPLDIGILLRVTVPVPLTGALPTCAVKLETLEKFVARLAPTKCLRTRRRGRVSPKTKSRAPSAVKSWLRTQTRAFRLTQSNVFLCFSCPC